MDDANDTGFRTIYPVRPPRPSNAARADAFGASDSNVVFFGNSLSVECQRCGAFCATSAGHKYCSHVTCPIALREFKRRKRKRTSTLEQVYMPQLAARRGPPASAEPESGRALP